ncbi:hypothetical protein BTA51_10140 [Hahella sp. CCB-MM4]|uniref:hypothetical protein n=1 Tax=Hahella sp. (strain CCB-MM4) TaxID=1926491 RepID=UPI000B9C050A|nr:hypothetical protein [Hahella sp. CCB-MM4]OZG73379.1 hypothetical protein BTA51_10140 [Hahella sp. CCB-MM4]
MAFRVKRLGMATFLIGFSILTIYFIRMPQEADSGNALPSNSASSNEMPVISSPELATSANGVEVIEATDTASFNQQQKNNRELSGDVVDGKDASLSTYNELPQLSERLFIPAASSEPYRTNKVRK